MTALRLSSVLVMGAALCGSVAIAAPASDRLLPLSDKDAYSTSEMGCQFAFDQGRATYVFMIGRSLLIRTAPGRAGLHACRITDRQFGGFGDGGTAISCAGRSLAVRRTGRVTSNPEADSAGGPALLTITRHGRTRAIRGTWGSAC